MQLHWGGEDCYFSHMYRGVTGKQFIFPNHIVVEEISWYIIFRSSKRCYKDVLKLNRQLKTKQLIMPSLTSYPRFLSISFFSIQQSYLANTNMGAIVTMCCLIDKFFLISSFLRIRNWFFHLTCDYGLMTIWTHIPLAMWQNSSSNFSTPISENHLGLLVPVIPVIAKRMLMFDIL